METEINEPSYRKRKMHEKTMCKNCKSTAHSSLQYHKHYKEFHAEKKKERMDKHLKALGLPPEKFAPKSAVKPTVPEKQDSHVHRKGMPKTYDGKSTKLGHGGRAAKLRDEGVPGAVIGAIARSKGAAPGGPNYHGKKSGK